jgi:sulfide:quinone oxidoreductase
LIIDDLLRSRGADFRIEVTTPEPRPMPILPPEAGERVMSLLAERDITYSPQHRLVAVEAGRARFDNEAERSFDLLLAVPPHRAPVFLREVANLTDDSGMIPVDRETLMTAVPGVYAVGDVAKAMSYTEMPIPRAGVLAEGQGRVVAANVAAELRGEPAAASFDGKGYCFVEVGGGRALRAEGEFFATPAPLAHFAPQPSEADFQAKVAFEAERLAEWFGT